MKPVSDQFLRSSDLSLDRDLSGRSPIRHSSFKKKMTKINFKKSDYSKFLKPNKSIYFICIKIAQKMSTLWVLDLIHKIGKQNK